MDDLSHIGNKKLYKINMKNSIILFNKNLPNKSAIVYNNAEINKLQILSDNKGKVGIYMWTHIESSKRYIGLVVNLSKRLSLYFSKKYLNRFKKVFIYNI